MWHYHLRFVISSRSGFVECDFECLDECLDRFFTAGHADEEGVDAAGFGPFEFRIVGEHHIGADQSEVGAEARAFGETEGVVEGGGFLEVFEREGKQATEAAGFAAYEVVVLTGGYRRMPNACDGRVILQPFGE